jgi:hypothetical protein
MLVSEMRAAHEGRSPFHVIQGVMETHINFPPLQNSASRSLERVMQQGREMKSASHAGE